MRVVSGALLLAFVAPVGVARADTRKPTASASSTAERFAPAGALDGDRFSADPTRAWQGRAGDKSWWWQVEFPAERAVGALLQIVGDQPLCLNNAPIHYIWQVSRDGVDWKDIPETAVTNERRTFRIFRLSKARRARFLRLKIEAAEGAPTLREVEVYDSPLSKIEFPPWAVLVDTTGAAKLPGEGTAFVGLARSCKDWDKLQAQNVWLGGFDEAFVAIEPTPLCAFLSGNFKDWCQQNREHWRGPKEVLRNRRLPMWASCGGAQGLAILEDTGVDKPWDCPRCRDPNAPKLPIYTHIGHKGPGQCGVYDKCIFERGPHNVLQTAADPVFAGLPREFRAMESHCGQIAYPPKDWVLLATKGEGTLTKMQCLRVKDRYIYAAQFHIEMAGTPESSRTIMANFLNLAKAWGGYNPQGKPVPEPMEHR